MSSSKGSRLRNLQLRLPVAAIQVRCAATHGVLGSGTCGIEVALLGLCCVFVVALLCHINSHFRVRWQKNAKPGYFCATTKPHQSHINAEFRPVWAHLSHFDPVPGVGLFLYRGADAKVFMAAGGSKNVPSLLRVSGFWRYTKDIQRSPERTIRSSLKGGRFNAVSLASNSTAAVLHSLPPTAHAVTAPVRGVAMCKALGR